MAELEHENGERTERARRFHEREHEQERLVAKETAQRLEREVDEEARRLEREVEETAQRLEKGVEIALAAVATTALIHADNHAKEHAAHERIHSVEKDQVAKAEASMNRRLEGMNEFRAALKDAQATFLTRDLYDEKREQMLQRVTALERRMDIEGGKKEGISDTAKVAYSILVALATILSVAAVIVGFTR